MFTLSFEKMFGCRNGSTNDSMSTLKSFTKSSTSTATTTIWSSSWQTQVSLDCDSKCSTFLQFFSVVSSSILWSYSHVASIFSTSMIVQHWQQINGHYFPMWSIVTMVKISSVVFDWFSTENLLYRSNFAQKLSIHSISSVNRSNVFYHLFACQHIFIFCLSTLNTFSSQTICFLLVPLVDILLHVKLVHFRIRHIWQLVRHCMVKITCWNVPKIVWD